MQLRRIDTAALTAALLVLCFSELTHGQSPESEGSVEWGGELKLELRRAQGQDAARGVSRDLTALDVEVTLEASKVLSPLLLVAGEIELSERQSSRDPVDEDGQLLLDDTGDGWTVHQLYLERRNAEGSARWRLGRQGLDDSMRWIVDEDLDGLRFTRDLGRHRLDLSYTRQQWLDLESEPREDKTDNTLLRWRIQASDDAFWMPWALRRSADAFADEPASDTRWAGLQGVVRLNKQFGYWVNLAVRKGEQTREPGNQKLGGHAIDVGMSYTFEQRFDPSLTLGYARASGDADRDDARDDRFRQSGLHSNEFAINGQNRFRYLGEVLDPELTNIDVLTLGLGFDPGRKLAADLVYHHYRQNELDDRLRGADLEYDPAGISRHLGDGLDVIVGYEPIKSLDLQAVAGVFFPGTAFIGAPDKVWVVGLELEYGFP